MATGSLDANGIWIYGEDDSEATFSALLNKLGDSTSDQIGSLKLAGRVVQMVTSTSATQRTTTSTSFVSASLTATITPRSASNKIIILVQSATRTDQNDVAVYHTVFRGTVAGTNVSGGSTGRMFSNLNNINIMPLSVNLVDSPGTTSATTYTLAFRSDNAARTVYTNADGALATMILLEVAA